MSNTGRLPKISDNVPIVGEKTNCIKAQDEDKRPPQKAALAVLSIPTSFNRSGIIGNITPMPIISSNTTLKMSAIRISLNKYGSHFPYNEFKNLGLF